MLLKILTSHDYTITANTDHGQEENTNIYTYLYAVSLTFAKCHSYDYEDHERFLHKGLYVSFRKCTMTC